DAASRCGPHRREPARRERTRDVVAAAHAAPALYTVPQAHAGAAVYRQYCIQCHGADLQGTAGPAVAGTEFLNSAKGNRWSMSDLRTTVVENMPFSNPGSLTQKQYADVMAFLLASNCYPAGTTPFPTANRPAYAHLKIGPQAGAKPVAKTGVCALK
ncbi:MAG: cytochrome c, partial [Candidatus Eremiobacteraeota bacterium]|nr:cytochrome c [Candidatus Eremiobacteraeota bacterium]